MRRLGIAAFVRAGLVLEVDPWLDMTLIVEPKAESSPDDAIRVIVAQPLVEDFKLDGAQAGEIHRRVQDANASYVIPHPRSPETYGLPILDRVDGEAAELAVLRCGGVAVGFCSSTQYNLSALGESVEFLDAPESIPSLLQHRHKLDEASNRRTNQFAL